MAYYDGAYENKVNNQQNLSNDRTLTQTQLNDVADRDPLVKETMAAVHSEDVRDTFEETTAKNEIYIKSIVHKYYVILLIILGLIIVSVIMIVVDVYLRYGDVVSMYDKNRSPDMPSGFKLGVALRVPVIAGWLGFRVKSFPDAVYISYKSKSLHDKFMANPGGNIRDMWGWSNYWIGGSRAASADESAIAIVCNTWNWQDGKQTINDCMSPCPTDGSGWSKWTSTGISAISQGLMLSASGGVGIGVGILTGAMSFLSAGGIFSHKHHSVKNCIS